VLGLRGTANDPSIEKLTEIACDPPKKFRKLVIAVSSICFAGSFFLVLVP
jgi:hypothetical protein